MASRLFCNQRPGPFVAGRIIDLSASARRLGYKENGLARVRVQVLAEQSLRLEKLAKNGKFPSVDGVPSTAMPRLKRRQNQM